MASPYQRQRRRHRIDPDPVARSGKLDNELTTMRHSAITTLLTAVNNLGDPVIEALDRLSGEQFTDLVWQAPDRIQFLTDLRVPAAKRPTAVAAQVALAKLRRWQPENRRRAGGYLTNTVAARLNTVWREAASVDHSQQHVDQALLAVLTEDPGQANVWRLTLVAHGHTSWAMTIALRLGLTHGLALPSWTQEAQNAVTAACEALEEHWPSF